MSTPLEEPNPSYSSKDSSIDESTFEEDYNKFEREQLEPTELYNKIGAPVPLPVKASEGAGDIQTVFNLDFAKLPMGMKSVSVSANDDKIILPKKSTKRVEIPVESVPNEDGTQRVTASTQTQTLYSMYPKQDPRLVYLKYKEHGDWEIKNKGYASYLANVENLLKSKSLKSQYQVESGENPGNRQLEGRGKTGGEIQFNSLFESGNLYAAFQVSDLEYDLILQNDINTRGHTQWFFFSVQNVPKDKAVKFNIVNLLKPDSLFSEGMKPVVFSSVQHESDGSGWTRSGFDISYSKNSLTKENDYAKTYYTLSFSYTFKHANDTVYFAHSFPYTYSDLKDFLQKITTDENTKIHVTRRTLCYTLSKNKCEYVSITSPYNLQEVEKRVGIAITARQHPGESLSSYIMEGAIEFLVSNQPEAQFLRNHCVFKIVPMLNPDGVIHGNYRASLCGRDLNRNWTKPNPILQPTIYHTKELVRRLQAKRSLALFCDLHGHSRKKNAFFYGNATSENPWGARMFPFLLSKSCKYASFEDSRFTMQKSKENTARIALWKEFKIDNIFTLEASFYGYKHEGMIKHFTKEDYKNLGVDLCKAMHVYIKQITLRVTIPRPVPDSEAVKDRNGGKQLDPAFGAEVRRRSLSVPENHEAKAGKVGSAFDCVQLMAELKSNKKLLEVGNKDDDSGSGTDNSEDDIPMKYLQKVLPIKSITKRKKVKSLDPNKKKPVVKKDEKKDEKKEEKKDERQSPFAKLYSSLERPKASHKLYKRLSQVNREPFKDCMFLEDETTKDVEMVSQASQTDEYLSRVLDYQESPVLMKGKQPMYRPLNGGYDQKAWFTYQGDKAYRSKSPQPLTEDQLFVVGAKTGLELHSTIDVTYKLKKNQISRSILARLNSKVFEREQEKDQVEIVKGRGSEALVIFSSQQGLVKGITSSNNRLYNSCQKEDSRYMSVQCIDKISPSPSPLLEKIDGFKGDTQKYISSRLLAREESEKRKSLSQKAMIGKEIISLAPSLMAGQKSTQRMISKDRLLGPLPQLLNMHTGKILSKEALLAGLIGTSTLPKKVKSNGESQHDESYFRSRLSRITPQGPGTNPLPSSREVSVRLGKRRERASQGVMREAYPETQIYETSNNNTSGVKNQSMSPSKTRVSRLDNLLLGDIKPDYDKKNLEVELLNLKKGRKSQSTIIRKL